MLHAALILAIAIKAPPPCSDAFLQNSWALLATARYGQSPFEKAAFAVADSDGQVTFARWPFEHTASEARFKGSVPANAFAIVHTHPNGRKMPSDDDRATSARLGIPVYVLTRNAITRTDGTRSEYITLGDWNPERCAER